jgi:Rrf2 family protein
MLDSTFSIAVHALVYLDHENKTLNSKQLAENICTNPARVRKVISPLIKAGYIQHKKGLQGGYRLNIRLEDVTLAQVAQVMDTHFVASGWHSGSMDMDCVIASGISQVMDGIYAQLDAQCHNSLKAISLADIRQQLFAKKNKD